MRDLRELGPDRDPVATLARRSAQEAPPCAEPAASAEAAPLTETQRANLAAGDAADGKVDHVVGQCNSCALHMEGDPTYKAQAGDYELHFCSASCLEAYEADPAKGLEQMGENAKQL